MSAREHEDEASCLRVPPHSIEAEQSVLGGLLIENQAWDRASGLITDGDFYRREHRLIYTAIRALIDKNRPADVVTVFEQLERTGDAKEAGGLAYLNALAQSVPSASNLRRYAEIVREKALLRTLIAAGSKAVTLAFESVDASATLDQVATLFAQIDRRQDRQQPVSLAHLLVRALDRYTALAEGTASMAIPTGIAPLDRLLNGGVRPGKVYGIAARPSVGKSSAGRSIGLHAARQGHATLLLSQEMQGDEVADCLVAELGHIDSQRVQTGAFQDDDWSRMTEVVDVGQHWPFYVDEQGGLTLQDMRAKARASKGLQVLILDYLQLSRSTLKGATTNDQVAEISKGLKALAMEMKIAVIVLSQLNRDVEKRVDKEPQLSDLRDSGAIEQDLDVAIMLWTAREYEEGSRRIVGWKVAKHRGGPKGRFAMEFDAPRYRWHEASESIDRASSTRVERGADL